MRSSDVYYEQRKCDWWGRTEAQKEWCQIFRNGCLGERRIWSMVSNAALRSREMTMMDLPQSEERRILSKM